MTKFFDEYSTVLGARIFMFYVSIFFPPIQWPSYSEPASDKINKKMRQFFTALDNIIHKSVYLR